MEEQNNSSPYHERNYLMSKKYDEAKAKIEAGKAYTPLAAVSLVKGNSSLLTLMEDG